MTTVALIFGGRSGEHGISCVTAGSILRHIDRSRFDIIPIGITTEGRFVRVSDDPEHWQIRNGLAPHVPTDGEEIIIQQPRAGDARALLRVVGSDGMVREIGTADVFFTLLHGPYGEDGTIQGFFELFDIPFVGSGSLASAAGMDKDVTKRLLERAGIKVAPGTVVHRYETREHGYLERVRELRPPLFVKPARAGSSLGVRKIASVADLDEALAFAFAHDPKVLVESAIHGREVECGVLATGPQSAIRTTLPGEVKVGDDLAFYDYESKYFGKGTVQIQVPARISESSCARVREIAARTFEVLGLEGLARVDVFVTEDDQVFVNEVNTMPGFTHVSMFPVLWQNMGMTYPDLITELIEHALHKPRGLH